MKALIIDDHIQVYQSLLLFFEDYKKITETHFVTNPLNTKMLTDHINPDLIFLDFHFKGFDKTGDDILNEISNNHIPIILLSDKFSEKNYVNKQVLFLEKPFKYQDVDAILRVI